MNDIGFDITQALPWFPHEKETPFTLVRVSEEHVRAWQDALGIPLRRCYVTDALTNERSVAMNVAKAQIVAAKLPDTGSTMAGDFGEILVYFYQASKEHPQIAVGPKKWRLKQDRTKPAPYSDVIHFVLPTWPTPSDQDVLLCSEVKTKSTDGNSTPIQSAIEDSNKDRTSRLAKTLVWLKERALSEDLGSITIQHLERFINATDHPIHTKKFRAVAVVCASLVDQELEAAPTQTTNDYSVIVISVPQLKQVYETAFKAAHQSVAEPLARGAP